ncbi:MAG TPA: hypothetical protein VK190_04990 [Pseudoneobacillus sp.]|nr:hypothetical protein [Pseudoneobacillus sp.]
MQILGIDAGNYETKIVHEGGCDVFFSAIGEWKKRNAGESHSSQDMEYEYDGIKGFAGPLALVESEYGGTVYGTTKNHLDAKLRILLAIHRNLKEYEVGIVVGQPYDGHTDEEKNEIIQSLIGPHIMIVNDIRKEWYVKEVRVGIEGAMAFLSAPFNGPVNIIDVGSGTVNCIHFLNKRIVDRKSKTLPFGSETNKNGINFEGMASGIFKQMSGLWDKNHPTYICGGSAKMIMPCLKRHYPLAELLPARMVTKDGARIGVDVKFANAAGMFIAGVKAYSGQLQTR